MEREAAINARGNLEVLDATLKQLRVATHQVEALVRLGKQRLLQRLS